jgi:hypothetical protein
VQGDSISDLGIVGVESTFRLAVKNFSAAILPVIRPGPSNSGCNGFLLDRPVAHTLCYTNVPSKGLPNAARANASTNRFCTAIAA